LGTYTKVDIEDIEDESLMPVQACQGLISDDFRDPDFHRDNVKLPPQILATDILPDEPPPIQQPNQLLVYLATRVLSSNALKHNEPISMMDTLVQIDEGAAVNIMNRKLAIALEAKIDHDDDPYTICGIGGLCDGSQSCIVFLQFQHADNPDKRTSIRVKFILTDTLLGVPLLIGTHTMNGLRMRTNAHDISGIDGRVCRMGRGNQECYVLHEPWAMVKLRSQGLNKTTFESGIQRLIYYSPAKTYDTSEEMTNATSPSNVFSSTTPMASVNVTTVLHTSPTPKDPHFVVSAIYNSPPETRPGSPTSLHEASPNSEIPNLTSGELELQSVLAAVKSLQDTNQVIDDILTEQDDDISELEEYCLLRKDETGRPPLFPIKYWCKVFDDQRSKVIGRWSIFSEERLQQILQELPNIDINPARPNQKDYLYAQMLANLDCYFIPNEEVPTPLKGFIYRIHTTTEEPQVARRTVQWSFLQKIYMEVKMKQLMKANRVSPSFSAWRSNVMLVEYPERVKAFMDKHKADVNAALADEANEKEIGTFYRCTIDLTPLNKVTISDEHPMPNCMDIIDRFQGCNHFTSADACDAFWLCELDERDRFKTAFQTSERLMEWNVMPQGHKNSAVF